MITKLRLPTDAAHRSAQNSVYESLRKAIVDNTLAPGTPLRATDLAQRLGVSPTPVREALIRLVSDRLAVGRPNRGVVVAPLSVEDVRNLYDIRSVVEGLAAARAAERIDAAGLARLRQTVEDMGRLLAAGRLRALIARNRDFHETIHAACGNPPLEELLRGLLDRTQRFRNLCVDMGDRLEQAHREHIAVLDPLERRDGALAEARMRANIRAAGAAVARHIEALGQGAEGGPHIIARTGTEKGKSRRHA